MKNISTSTAAVAPPQQLQALWAWIKRRRLLVGSAAIVALGLGLGWNWLAAAGVLPFLFASLPCALMLGLCMKGMGSGNPGGADSQNGQSASTDSPPTDGPASLPGSSSSISSSPLEETTHE